MHTRQRHLRQRSAAVLLTVLTALLWFTAVPAGTEKASASASDNWSYVLYNNNSGMPFSEANALQQTADGFIYIGCYGGLLRFDGESFYRYEDSRLSNIISLYTDSRDRLFIGTNSSGFGILDKGEFTFFGEEDGLKSLFVRTFLEDRNGNILIGTSEGLYCLSPENELQRISDPRLDSSIISCIYSDNQGILYGLTKNSEIFTLENMKISSWIDKGGFIRDSITSICPDPQNSGYLYIGLDTGGLLYGNPLTHRRSLERLEVQDLVNINDLLYREDRLWIASDRGVAYIDRDGSFVRPDKMQRSDSVQFIMADREGNIWAASDRIGVIKFSPSIFTNINSLADLPAAIVNTTFIKDGILYIGTDSGLICLDSQYQQVATPVSEMLKDERIRCIREDRNGCVWFCTWSQGLVGMEDDGNIQVYAKEDGFFSNSVREVYEMADGTLAISVRGGVYYLRDGKIVQSFQEEDGITTPHILSMCEYEPGKLLLGSDGNGILVIEENQVRPFALAENLSYDVVLRINPAPDNKSFWILTGTALYVLHDGELTNVPNIPNLHNYDIFFDNQENAWILAADGIHIGKAADMLEGKTVRYTHYDYKSGLPFIVTPHCRNYIDEDGTVYMSGNDGVVRIEVNHASDDNSDPQLTIPSLEVDNETIFITPGQKVTLSSGVKRITVDAFALSFSMNEPVVSYQLKGFDETESIVNRSALPSLTYTNLKGGSYTFCFSLLDPATGNVLKTISLPIVKKKAYYEQPLFWVLVCAAVIGIAFLCLSLYLKKKSREMEMEREQDRIRTELSLAGSIQASMLPRKFPAFPERKEFDLYASMDPAKEVGGDFYDFFLIDEDHLAMVIADVSGKGMGAALFMMIAKSILKTTTLTESQKGPGRILQIVNEKLCEDNEASMFVTVWLGILTISTGRLVSANGGHEYPVIFREKEGCQLEKDKHGPPLGAMDGVRYRETEWTLNKGEGLFVYTDGVPEANNAEEELFGTERMLNALKMHEGDHPEEILKGVRKEVDNFVGDVPQFDDLTMLALRLCK